MSTAYNFGGINHISKASNVHEAIRATVLNYQHDQLGWSREKCDDRVKFELERIAPVSLFNALKSSGWNLTGAKLLEVGSGPGGGVMEALLRGADAYGVEPSDEFRILAQMRLEEAGQDPERILSSGGEALPFADDSFDLVISLQVLEHVRSPALVMKEIYRVLKPGGQCFISCENYLSFREQHYRVPWLPLLPKILGTIYLRLLGRNPSFLKNYVFYSTYPQIWRAARQIGFHNVTLKERLARVQVPAAAKSKFECLMAACASILPTRSRVGFITNLIHMTSFWRVGVQVRLVKPDRTQAPV